MTKYNFYAGPAILPKEVLEKASQSVQGLGDLGLSILEISHRSKEVTAIMENAVSLVKEHLGIGDDFEVLFLQGGASSQFYMSAMNMLGAFEHAGYVDTGTWSTKSIKEAMHFGHVKTLASSKDKNYSYIPKGYDIPKDLKYLHITSNNTISGTQLHTFPDTQVPFVCDASSDIFSRPMDMSNMGILYAGAQKNLGPAGATLVVINKKFLEGQARKMPTMLDYHTHIKKQSSFNTPPVFPIYVSMLTLEWIKGNGGVGAMQKRNEEKAALLYDEIDRNPLFKGTAATEDRSLMNVCFLPVNEEHTDSFLEKCASAGCVGVKGHRSVGGFRASIYNAMPREGVEALVEVMKDFEKTNG